jgi:hypothetical protein
VSRGSLELEGLRGPKELLGHRDYKAYKESKVSAARRGTLVNRVPMEFLASKEFLATRVPSGL